jgi:hypothetical protein
MTSMSRRNNEHGMAKGNSQWKTDLRLKSRDAVHGQISLDSCATTNSKSELTDQLRVSRNRLSITILLGTLIALASFGYFSHYCTDALFSNDAADYVRGAKIGFVATYFDTRSVGLWGSIQIAKQYPEARQHFFDFLQQRDDAAPNRHFHVAPGIYGAVIASQFGAANRTYRLIMAAAAAIGMGAIFIGLRLAGVHLLLALATAVLATVSPAIVQTSSVVAGHAPFMAALIASGFAFAQYLETSDPKWGIASGVTLGFAVAVCELSMVICAAFGLILVWRAFRSGIESTLNRLSISGVSLLGTLLLLWPGGVIRGSYGLSYGAWVLYILFRRGHDFHENNPSVIFARGSQGSPLVIVLFVVIVIGVLILELTRNSNLHIQVFSWLVLGFFTQGMLNTFKNQTYVSHFITVTWVLLALISHQWIMLAKGRARYAAVAAVCGMYLLAAIPASRWPLASARAAEEERAHATRAEEAIALANKIIPRGATILGNFDYEIWALYLPQYVVEHTMSASDLEPRPWIKMPEDYWIIADPQLLSADWHERLGALSPSYTADGYILAHTGVPRN